MLAKIFQDHGAKAFMGMAITFAGFHGKSLEALVQFLYTGEVGKMHLFTYLLLRKENDRSRSVEGRCWSLINPFTGRVPSW